MRYNPSSETFLEYLRRSRPCNSFSSAGVGSASRSIPVPSAQILPFGIPFPSSTESVFTSLTASTSLTRSCISSVSFACSVEPSSGGIKALRVWRCFKVAGEIVGLGYEDKSSLTDHVGWTGIPCSSVLTSARSVCLDEREELSLAKPVGSRTRRRPRVVLSIIGNSRRPFPPVNGHGTKTTSSRQSHSTLLTVQTTSYPLEHSFFPVPGVVTVPTGWRRTESVPDAVGNQGIPGLLLGSHPNETETRGETWEGLGPSCLEGCVCLRCGYAKF